MPGRLNRARREGIRMRITAILNVPRRTRRVAHIARTCAKHGLGYLVARMGIQQYLPGRARIAPSGLKRKHPGDLPARFARILEELGPTFVKFGQMLSTRADLLPDEYVEQLQRICHHVAPFPGKVSRAIVEEELGQPIEEVFEEFCDEPLASGSIAQVHAARLVDGPEVVVKVRRPAIERTIEDDLAIMEFLASRADQLEEFKLLRLPMLVEEFGRSMRREQNLLSEAANTHKFHVAFRDDEQLLVPKVYWDQSGPRVLTMQRLEGTYLSELAQARVAPEVKREVARTLLDRFMVQFFDIGSFHADPHTGNILLTEDHRVALIDFGLVGRLSETLRGQLTTFVIALGSQQLELAAEVLGEIGSLPPDVEAEEFQAELASLMDRHYSVPFEKIDPQQALQEVMQVVRKYRVVMPRDLVLLGKALVSVAGLVMRLDPELKAVELAVPYARKLARDRLSPKLLMRSLTSHAYHLGMLLKSTPRDLREMLRRLRSGAVEFAVDHRGLEKYVAGLERTGNRLALSIILAAVIISSTFMLTAKLGPVISLLGAEASALGLVGYLVGLMLGLWLVIGILRSGRI